MEIYMDDLTHEFPYDLGNDFKYIETLAHGAFGTVIHVIEISTKKDMAIKVINKTSSHQSSIEKVKQEISILKQLNHKNIVKFYGFFETVNQLLIKMEYVKYGTLKKWIKNHKKITEEEASIILSQILSAVVYLHGKQICHRDIKPENIMLSKENDLNSIKIIDFGLSAQHFYRLINNDYCGTYIYMAPEQIEKKLYFISVDIWSIGILMFMLLNNGKHPFYVKGETRKDFTKKIQNCKINFYNKISPMANHLLFKLLEPNPSWRYNAAQALKHPWITRNKNDEVPLTFNEILHKANMKKIGKELFGAMLFINYIIKEKKFFIDNKYIQSCNFYDKKMKIKNMKKKEKCLDVLSTSDGDESEPELIEDKKCYTIKKINDNERNLGNNSPNTFVRSANNVLYKMIKAKKMNFVKSTKNIKSSNRINNTDKKIFFYFKRMDYQLNLFSAKKRAESLKKNNNEINNTSKTNLINLFIKSKNNKEKEILKRNALKGINYENNKEFNYKSLKIMNSTQKSKFLKKYDFKHSNKKQFPDLNFQIRQKHINGNHFSLNESENYNLVSLVLPNIKSFQKADNFRKNVKKINIGNKFYKIKNS